MREEEVLSVSTNVYSRKHIDVAASICVCFIRSTQCNGIDYSWENVGGIEGLCVITPVVHGETHGYFTKTYNENDMKEVEVDIKFAHGFLLVLSEKD